MLCPEAKAKSAPCGCRGCKCLGCGFEHQCPLCNRLLGTCCFVDEDAEISEEKLNESLENEKKSEVV